MAESIFVNVAGVWKEIDALSTGKPSVNVSGVYRDVSDVYVNVAGAWRHTWPLNPPPLNLSVSGVTHLTIWTGGLGDTGTCFANGCGGVGAACFPRNLVPSFTVQTLGFAGANPLIKAGSQTVSYSASAYLDFGFHLWYEINSSGTWNYAALLAGTHIWSAQGWMSNAGSFAINVPTASIVKFATTAGTCWQDHVQSGSITLNFPNT